MSPAYQTAWLAFYTSLRDNPDATPEERKRGEDMLKKGAKLGIQDLSGMNPEDFA